MLSIVEHSIENALTIYPNPCNELLFIEITNANLEAANTVAELYTMQGQLLKRIELNTPTTSMPVDDLKTGIYYVTVKSAMGVYSKKIVKN